jgi:hypothetical protein
VQPGEDQLMRSLKWETHSQARRRVIAALAFATVVVGAVLPAGAANAAVPIELSTQGVVWNTSLPGGLFDGFAGAVPGDSVTRSFYVKNPTDLSVTMKVRATDVVPGTNNLGQSITVLGAVPGHALAAPVTLASLTDCATLAPDVVLAGGAVTRVTITLAMLDVSGSLAQAADGGFDVLLTMQDNAAGAPATSCDGAGVANGGGTANGGGASTTQPAATGSRASRSGPLAFTGVDIVVPIELAILLLGVGLFILIVRRRRKENEE